MCELKFTEQTVIVFIMSHKRFPIKNTDLKLNRVFNYILHQLVKTLQPKIQLKFFLILRIKNIPKGYYFYLFLIYKMVMNHINAKLI